MAIINVSDPAEVQGGVRIGRPDLDGIEDWNPAVPYNDQTARAYWREKGLDGPPAAKSAAEKLGLSACPFCRGSSLAMVQGEYVACWGCEATGPMRRAGFDPVEAWNAAPRAE